MSKPQQTDWAPFESEFELEELQTDVPDTQSLCGKEIEEISTCLGTCGGFGPGFFGMKLGGEWLVVAIWSADRWIELDGCALASFEIDRDSHQKLSDSFLGQTIVSAEITRRSLKLECSNSSSFVISESEKNRLAYPGTGDPMVFSEEDDLREVVFMSPTDEIWI